GLLALILAFLGPSALGAARSGDGPRRVVFTAGSRYLIVEALDDDLLHFELSAVGAADASRPIYTTPMVAKTDYSGPRSFAADGRRVETDEMRVTVGSGLCVTVFDKARQVELHSICPQSLEAAWKGLTIASPSTRNV